MDGRWKRKIGVGLDGTSSVAVTTSGCIYVSGEYSGLISVFQPDGTCLRKWTEPDIQFHPYRITIGFQGGGTAADRTQAMSQVPVIAAFPPGLLSICWQYASEEHLWICDICSDCIRMFSIWDNKEVHEATFQTDLHIPRACVIGADGLMYVADCGNNRILVCQPDGEPKQVLVTAETVCDSQFYPNDIVLDFPTSRMYVSDGSNNCIYCFQLSPTKDGAKANLLFTFKGDRYTVGTLRYPNCIVLQESTYLHIVDTNNDRILTFDVRTRACTRWKDSYVLPEGLAFGHDDTLYVAASDMLIMYNKN